MLLHIVNANIPYEIYDDVFLHVQNEKEEAEARFTKLKLQAKAKMAALNKQITDLKGQGATVSCVFYVTFDFDLKLTV